MKVTKLYYQEAKSDWNHTFEGRVLGLLDRSQFAALHRDAETLVRKVKSIESKDLEDIVLSDDYKDNRLAFAISNKFGIDLLVTGRISLMKSFTAPTKGKISSMELIDEYDNIITVMEDQESEIT